MIQLSCVSSASGWCLSRPCLWPQPSADCLLAYEDVDVGVGVGLWVRGCVPMGVGVGVGVGKGEVVSRLGCIGLALDWCPPRPRLQPPMSAGCLLACVGYCTCLAVEAFACFLASFVWVRVWAWTHWALSIAITVTAK